MSYTSSVGVALGASHAGLALRADLFDAAGAAAGGVTAGFVEVGSGYYLWTHAFADGFRGGVAFAPAAGGPPLAFTAVNPEELAGPVAAGPYTSTVGVALGAARAGLTLAAQLIDTAGLPAGGPVAAGFAETGGGNYLWTHTFPAGFRGGVTFAPAAGGPPLAFAAVNPEELAAAAPPAVTPPVPPPAGGVAVDFCDDYLYLDNREAVTLT